jgi:hypothetical protein
MRKRSISIIAAIAVTAVAVAASVAVAGTVTGSDGSSLSTDVKLSPKKLSKTVPTPAAVKFASKSTTTNSDGMLNPLAKIAVDFDKSGTYSARGLPTCHAKALLSKEPRDAERICGKARIGSGKIVASVSFIGAPPLDAEAEALVFNGVPKGGKPTVVLYAYGKSPVAASYVVSGVVSKYRKAGYGSRFEVQFPELFGGSGAVREFNFKIDRKFTYKHKKRSVISAKCPSSKKLKLRVVATYKNGETITVPSTQRCTPKR